VEPATDLVIRCGQQDLDRLAPTIASFLARDTLDLVVDGERIRGYRTPDARSVWIRDHSDMMRGFRHAERDMTSAVQHFADTQSASGRIFDYVTTWPEKLPSERENWTKYVRVPVEADVEYRFVKAAFLAWQATSDDEWLAQIWPSLERALAYVQRHAWYWDACHDLPKRAYTIDTWDFAYTAGAHEWLQFQITDDTFWGFMHGDASGYAEAFGLMARMGRRLGMDGRAAYWSTRAAAVTSALNRTCWNGRFYTHFVKLSPVVIAGVDETAQLSLSNPMDINRGVTTHDQAVSILREYQRRGREGGAFAEWFSIDPPFPDGIFGDDRLVGGAYVNGGIMPLVGGELAHAALEHGFERYGVEILRRYAALIGDRGETFLWYFPDGRPSTIETSTSPEALPTDGWGSSAMLWALTEGLAGVVDLGRGFDRVLVAPRWPAAGVTSAAVTIPYPASGRSVAYQYRLGSRGLRMEVGADAVAARFHVLLPERADARHVFLDGHDTAFRVARIEDSRYVDFEARVDGRLTVEVGLAAADGTQTWSVDEQA
jgi:hypothetical protein